MSPLGLLLLLSCAEEPAEPVVESPYAALTPLDAPRLLRRSSLDLRGVLPSAAELDAVAEDPDQLRVLQASWFEDPRFQDRFVQLLAERWHTRVDAFEVTHRDYYLEDALEYRFERDVGEEPLRLMAHVVAEDLPWSEVVLSEQTMATELLASVWPLDYPEGAEGWQPASYTDHRPGAGVLSTNGFYWRYTTDQSNMNRSRAAALFRLLLCEDFLLRPVSFSLDELEGDIIDPAEAVHSDPYCLACHAALDPVASSMFGFWWLVLYSDIEDTSYHPERENLGELYLNTRPGYFGEPMAGLADLGPQVASDSRFYSCAVDSFAELLWRRAPTEDDWETLEALRIGFLEDEARPQGLLLGLMDTPVYQAGSLSADASPELVERERVARLLPPGVVASTLEELSGFRWEVDGFEQLDNDTLGFRVLAGGVDGENVTRPQTRPGLTWALVYKRAAQAAAQQAVARELSRGEAGAGLFSVDLSAQPGEAAFTEQLRALHWRLFAEEADEAWLRNVEGLWGRGEAAAGPEEAWVLVLTVMFRDPRFLSY